MSLCVDCVRGVTHEGTPKGKWEKIGGIDTYVSTPTGDYPKDKAILYLADVMGPQHINAQVQLFHYQNSGEMGLLKRPLQLLVDDFAAIGFKTYAPDYVNGDPVPGSAFTSPGSFDLPGWLSKHGEDVTRPPLDKVIQALKEEGVTAFGATGYCLGGRYGFDLAFENIVKVVVVSHPSLLKVPADLEKYYATSKAPLLINTCTFDDPFPSEACAKADEIFGDGKYAPGYKRVHFEGLRHGFAVRGDLNDLDAKAGKEGAFKSAAEWLLENF